jgi:acetyl esterase/lipase
MRSARLSAQIALFAAAAALLGACSPLGLLDAATPHDTYVATLDVAYAANARASLDIYAPRLAAGTPPPAAGYPVAVFFYGGTWVSGERADYRFVGEALASRGIIAIIPDYRLYPDVKYPDFLIDCARAVAWALREAPRRGGDGNRIYVMGYSSGAYNAAMLALDARWLADAGAAPSQLAGWIGLAGPYDFLPMTNIAAQPVFNHPDYPAGSQPVDYVTRAAPRTFLGAPADDDVVNPVRNTRQLAEKLKVAGVAVTLKSYPRTNHSTLIGAFARPLRVLASVLDDVAAFVRGPNTAP